MDDILSIVFYFTLAFFTGFCMYKAQTSNDKRWIYISIAVLTLVSGLRGSDVGVDTDNNIRVFYDIMEDGFQHVYREHLYYAVVWVFMFLFQSPSLLFTLFAFIIHWLVFERLWDFKEDTCLAIASSLFVLNYFGATMNGLRQYIAVAIIFFSTRYLFERKLIPYFVLVLISVNIHISSVIALVIPILFVDFKKIKEQLGEKNFKALIVCLGFSGLSLFVFLLFKYSSYLDNIKNFDLSFMTLVKVILLLLTYSFTYKTICRNHKIKIAQWYVDSYDLFFFIALFGTLFGFGNGFIEYISRIGYYFRIFELVFYGNIIYSNKVDIRLKLGLMIILVALGLYNFYAYHSVIPYYTIFQL